MRVALIEGMSTSTRTNDQERGLVAEGLVARARWVWYGMRPIWWRSWWGLRVSGLENLPKNGAMIFCGNHTSHLDAAAILAALPKKIALEVTTVAARDVWGERPMRRLIGRVTTNSVSLSRKGEFAAGFRMLDKVLGEGRPIIIFPEGKRSVSGEMGEFKPGAAMLAVRNGAPIVPVRIEGAYEVMPTSRMVPESGEIKVSFGKPIWPQEFVAEERGEKKRAFARIMQQLKERIIGLRPMADRNVRPTTDPQ